MTSVILSHRGKSAESEAVKALLAYYGCSVEERVLPLNELLLLTKGHARVHFEFRGKTYYSIDQFLQGLVADGHIYC